MSIPKITSGFALLDVKRGRRALARALTNGPSIPVVITGRITHQWGRDDGVSIEFAVDVLSVALGSAEATSAQEPRSEPQLPSGASEGDASTNT